MRTMDQLDKEMDMVKVELQMMRNEFEEQFDSVGAALEILAEGNKHAFVQINRILQDLNSRLSALEGLTRTREDPEGKEL